MEDAMPYVPDSSRAWRRIILFAENAYYGSDRMEEYEALLRRLAGQLTDSASRSQVLLNLAGLVSRKGLQDEAWSLYRDVIRLDAHPFDVQRAESALYEMDVLYEGADAPDLDLTTIDGSRIVLSDLRGKVVLLEFWATSCGPCLPDIPHLKTLHEGLSPTDFQLIGVTDDRDLEELEAFLEEREMRWPQVQEVVEWEGEAIRLGQARTKYNVYGIPRSFVIDRMGRLVAKDLRGEELVAAVRAAAGETMQ